MAIARRRGVVARAAIRGGNASTIALGRSCCVGQLLRAALPGSRRAFSRIDGYLHYYGKLKQHEGMLRDTARCDGYRRALEAAAPQLQGATVMDIGTGSGFLALLAARLGAKKVYAVEGSLEIARVASRLARANGFVGVVEVVPKLLEAVTEEDIPTGSVDVIVSELLSHFLVGETGLQVVTIAKNRFLKPGGLILPATAELKLAPFADPQLGAELRMRHSFWEQTDFHGLDLRSAIPLAVEQQFRELVLDVVEPSSLLVPPNEVPGYVIDMATPDDPTVWDRMSFNVSFPKRSKDATIDGLCGWWDVFFDGAGDGPAPVLSTGPDAPPTVWAQCRFMLKQPLQAKAGDNLHASCTLKVDKARESYTATIDLVNSSTGKSSQAGPVRLSDVYARHFARSLPFPEMPGANEDPAVMHPLCS